MFLVYHRIVLLEVSLILLDYRARSHTGPCRQQPLIPERLPDINVRMSMLKMRETPVEPGGIDGYCDRRRFLGQVCILTPPLPKRFAVPP